MCFLDLIKTVLYCTLLPKKCKYGTLKTAVDDTKRNTLDSIAGIPKVLPDTIKLYRAKPRKLEIDFQTLKTANPAIATELMIQAEINNNDLETKQAFTKGALFMYTLLLYSLQSQAVLSLLERSSFNVGVVDADQPPST